MINKAAKSSKILHIQFFCIMGPYETQIASQGKEIMVVLLLNKFIYLDFC